MRLALYQPDIPQNVGSIIRLSACLGVPLDIIEPCGFPFDTARMKRSALDYYEQADIHRHTSWQAYLAHRQAHRPEARLVLATTKGAVAYHAHAFLENDIIVMGRESKGVTEEVIEASQVRVYIPIRSDTRSLNVAQAASIILSEALRQQQLFPARPS